MTTLLCPYGKNVQNLLSSSPSFPPPARCRAIASSPRAAPSAASRATGPRTARASPSTRKSACCAARACASTTRAASWARPGMGLRRGGGLSATAEACEEKGAGMVMAAQHHQPAYGAGIVTPSRYNTAGGPFAPLQTTPSGMNRGFCHIPVITYMTVPKPPGTAETIAADSEHDFHKAIGYPVD